MVESVISAIEETFGRNGVALPDAEEWPADDEYADAFVGAIDSATHDLLGSANAYLLPRLAQEAEQHARVLDRWGEAVSRLDTFRIMCGGIASDYEEESQLEELAETVALERLFRSGYLVAAEVVTLIRNGYPGGALARARALYEVEMRAALIVQYGDEPARRFLEHEHLRERQETEWLHGWTKEVTKEQRRTNARLNDEAQDTYGRVFLGDYGWAHEALLDDPGYSKAYGQGRRLRGPTIDDICDAVARARRVEGKYFYLRANAAVHGAPRSFAVGRDIGGEHVLPDGPVTEGFWLAGRATAWALAWLTDSYVALLSNPEPADPPTDPGLGLHFGSLGFEFVTGFLRSAAIDIETLLTQARDATPQP